MSGVDESLVTPAVAGLLRSVLPCPVGVGVAPSAGAGVDRLDPDRGWVVVHVVPPRRAAMVGWGMVGQPDSLEWVGFQLMGVGVSQNHASLLALSAAKVLSDRSGGDWAHELSVAGHAVLSRVRSGRVPGSPGPGSWSEGQLVDVLVHAVT